MTTPRTILGLDLATRTGWAIVQAGRVTDSGVWDLRADCGEVGHYGHIYQALYRKLDLHDRDGVQVAYELAHHRAGPATRIGVGLNATCLLFAVRRDRPCPLSVHTTTLKKWSTGDGRADKATMKACARGLIDREPIDDNEADAIAVAMWGWEQVNKSNENEQ